MMSLAQQPYVCQYCKKGFMKEGTLSVHVCEQKRRALARTEKHVVIGYNTYNRFYKVTQNIKGEKSYDDFCKSPYYNAFIKFGSFVSNVNPLYPDKFIDFVLKSGVKLDHWCKDELYDQYLFDVLKVEPVESAVQRSLQTMMEWGDEHSAEFSHYFLYSSLNKAVYDIRNGNISPWVILNTRSGKEMIQKMNDEQLDIIAPAFDVPFWVRKFREVPADVALVKEICREVGID